MSDCVVVGDVEMFWTHLEVVVDRWLVLVFLTLGQQCKPGVSVDCRKFTTRGDSTGATLCNQLSATKEDDGKQHNKGQV